AWMQAIAGSLTEAPPPGPSTGEVVVLMIWFALRISMIALPWIDKAGRPNRVLLIVDDLDRCSPVEMLDVIEGMKLLVDDAEISRRLQVLMLVDEGVLGHAIANRYKTMIEERGGGDASLSGAEARREVIAEQNEKLFACHLRLPRLTDEDVAAVVSRVAGREIEALREQRRRLDRARAAAQRLRALARTAPHAETARRGEQATREPPPRREPDGHQTAEPIFDQTDVRF